MAGHLGFTISFTFSGESNSRSEWLAKLNSNLTPQHGHETIIIAPKYRQTENQLINYDQQTKITCLTDQEQEDIQKIVNNLLETTTTKLNCPQKITNKLLQNHQQILSTISSNKKNNNKNSRSLLKKQITPKKEVTQSIKQIQIPFLLGPSQNRSITKHRPIQNNGSINSNELKELNKIKNLKSNYYSNCNPILSTISSQKQLIQQNQKENQILISSNSTTLLNPVKQIITNTTSTIKPTSGILFLETKKPMAYSTVEELQRNVKVLNNKNQSQTDLPNDFTTTRFLNVETSQTITRPASSSADATYLTKSPTATTTTTTPIPTVTTIEEKTEFNSERNINNTTTNYFQLIDPLTDLELLEFYNKNNNLDNLTNIFDLEEDNLEKTKNIKMIEKDEDNFDIMMNIEGEMMNIDPKCAIPFDSQLPSDFQNIFDDVDKMHCDSTILNENIDFAAMYGNDETNYFNSLKQAPCETVSISTESVLVKDEELTTYDCINPNNVHAFPYEIENSITPPSSILDDTQIDNKINENYYNFMNFDNNNFNSVNFINSNTFNNNNNNTNNMNNVNGNKLVTNNIMDNLNSCNNTYRKKKTKALILKTDLQYNFNKNVIETPDVIKIVESFEAQKEKENMFPVDILSGKTLSDDSCSDSVDNISRIESPELDVGTQEFDKSMFIYQMSPSDSAISNCTSGNNNIPSPTIYENPLSVGGSSDISYSEDANLSISTSYVSNSPPPTPASQTSQTYSEYSSTQNSENTHIQSKSKKKRGRPALDHSSPPTLEQLKNSDPNKRKYLEQRYKNNEASRISRRNRKRKEEEEKEEELREIRRNAILKAKHAKLTKKHEYLKDRLRSIVAQS